MVPFNFLIIYCKPKNSHLHATYASDGRRGSYLYHYIKRRRPLQYARQNLWLLDLLQRDRSKGISVTHR